ncbi:hypothetical protein, partial [Escherichia coli]
YVTIVRRPLRGQVGVIDKATRRLFAKASDDGGASGEAQDLRELQDAVLNIRDVLQDYGARCLGIREPQPGVYFSEPLEFLVQIVNGLEP